jgi:hypothetical protein
LKRPPPALRLYFPNLRKKKTSPAFLPTIRRLGANAEAYALALVHLSDAGCQAAAHAMSALSKAAMKHEKDFAGNLRKAIDREKVAPVDLFPSARWKLDRAGLVALQILLCLWQFRYIPDRDDGRANWEPNKVYRMMAHSLEPFHDDSKHRWWKVAQIVFLDHFPHPARLKEFASVCAPSCKGSPVKHRNYILRKLRERFLGFAPPALPHRLRTRLVELRDFRAGCVY